MYKYLSNELLIQGLKAKELNFSDFEPEARKEPKVVEVALKMNAYNIMFVHPQYFENKDNLPDFFINQLSKKKLGKISLSDFLNSFRNGKHFYPWFTSVIQNKDFVKQLLIFTHEGLANFVSLIGSNITSIDFLSHPEKTIAFMKDMGEHLTDITGFDLLDDAISDTLFNIEVALKTSSPTTHSLWKKYFNDNDLYLKKNIFYNFEIDGFAFLTPKIKNNKDEMLKIFDLVKNYNYSGYSIFDTWPKNLANDKMMVLSFVQKIIDGKAKDFESNLTLAIFNGLSKNLISDEDFVKDLVHILKTNHISLSTNFVETKVFTNLVNQKDTLKFFCDSFDGFSIELLKYFTEYYLYDEYSDKKLINALSFILENINTKNIQPDDMQNVLHDLITIDDSSVLADICSFFPNNEDDDCSNKDEFIKNFKRIQNLISM